LAYLIYEFWVLRVPPIQIPTQNGGMKVLFNKFHRGINLVALLFSNLGSRNKTTYLKFINLKLLRAFSYKVWSLKVPYTYSLQYVESIHAPDLRIRFFFFYAVFRYLYLNKLKFWTLTGDFFIMSQVEDWESPFFFFKMILKCSIYGP
jgi:hypothetical protein